MVQIKNPLWWGPIRKKLLPPPILGSSGHPIDQKFLLLENFAFFWHLVTCPPLFFPKMNLTKNFYFFYVRYKHLSLEHLSLWDTCSSKSRIFQKSSTWWCKKGVFFEKTKGFPLKTLKENIFFKMLCDLLWNVKESVVNLTQRVKKFQIWRKTRKWSELGP